MPDIRMHESHAAVDVKVQARIPVPDNVPEHVKQRVWDETVLWFWEEVKPLAHQRGYAAVFSEGRSGGWCVPFYQRAADGRTQFDQWPGQGPDHGYPSYPDVTEPEEREKFLAFQHDVRQLLDEAKKRYAAECIAAEREDAMEKYVYNPDVCPSSLGEDDRPVGDETAHKWDETTEPVTCAECGTTKEGTKDA